MFAWLEDAQSKKSKQSLKQVISKLDFYARYPDYNKDRKEIIDSCFKDLQKQELEELVQKNYDYCTYASLLLRWCSKNVASIILRNYKVQINNINEKRETILFQVLQNEDVVEEVIEYFRRNGAVHYIYVADCYGNCALCYSTNPRITKMIIDAMDDPKLQEDKQDILSHALRMSILARNLESSIVLVESGADINKRFDNSGTPLMMALKCFRSNYKTRKECARLIKLMLEKGVDVSEGFKYKVPWSNTSTTLMHYAIKAQTQYGETFNRYFENPNLVDKILSMGYIPTQEDVIESFSNGYKDLSFSLFCVYVYNQQTFDIPDIFLQFKHSSYLCYLLFTKEDMQSSYLSFALQKLYTQLKFYYNLTLFDRMHVLTELLQRVDYIKSINI